ncbi:MAG: glycoside hydrolase family 13 protein, partial [Gammaproteobacteria bacterium]|nr:glycoside hydrolase family 13 protein [Gammaproteobacteria bacterium]
MNKTALTLILFLSLPMQALASIERVEPPFWWTGFKETGLQLLVYGDDISTYTPALDYEGARLDRVVRVDSPNYLFLYLDIGAEAEPGEFEITFAREGETLNHRYTLRQKNRDAAHARGFDESDAIYLITPDRFANGDPANDSIEGMADILNRSDKDGRHGGDIQGIIDSLPYIKEMGFTAIWLNPVLENDVPTISYHGYGATDFYAVDARYGSNEKYRELVQSAKAMGIGTIMDMIVNHSGETHWWMDDLPADDWINMPENPQVTTHQRYTNQDPNASEADKRAYADGWFVVPGMPDLNQRNPLLASYLTQNALWWIEYLGLAGIRMDTYPYPDKHYMAEWTRRLMAEYPDFNIVGEEWASTPATIAYWQRGKVNRDGYVSHLPSLMDFPLQEALWLALVTENGEQQFDHSPGGLERLYRRLSMDFLYPDPNALVIFPDNHDMDRIFTQLNEDYDLWRMAIAYVLTIRGTPQIYYGTEILMDSTEDSSHGYIRSDFPGGWEGDERSAYTGEGLTEREREAQAFMRTLLRWRRGKNVFDGGRTMHFVPEVDTYVYFRYDEEDSVMVVFNKDEKAVDLGLGRFAERLAG